ncbi:MAG: hypothetical protein PHV82_06815 [Victivallaceae bacterium]|nr:hypothetical protein [Victivallaceae bacterium]
MQKMISIENFGNKADFGYDTTLAVFQAVSMSRKYPAATLSFPEGEYNFRADYAYEDYYFISNNGAGLKRSVFSIFDCTNLTIDGQNSLFVFHGLVSPFIIDISRNIALKNIIIDYEKPICSQGTVIDASANHIDLSVTEEYSYRIDGKKLILLGDGWEFPLWSIMEFDAIEKKPVFGSGDCCGGSDLSELLVEKLQDGVLRLKFPVRKIPAAGNLILLRPYLRTNPGIFIKNSININITNVKIYHALAMGVVAQKSENINLEKLNTMLKPDSTRVFSAAGDAVQIVNCRGAIKIDGCLFENQTDDPINIHGIYASIFKIVSENTIILKFMQFQQEGVKIIAEKDEIKFLDKETLLPYLEARVKHVVYLNKSFFLIETCENISQFIKERDLVENISDQPEVEISNCILRNNRARGILISTGGRVDIRSNIISVPGAGIKISGDADFWYESGAVKNVHISSNLFLNCNYVAAWGKAIIDIDPEIKDPEKLPECYHRNILIENNIFQTFDTNIIYARSVDGLIFRNNKIDKTDTYPRYHKERYTIKAEGCKNIVVNGNLFDDAFDPTS